MSVRRVQGNVQGYIGQRLEELRKQQIMALRIAGEEAVAAQTVNHKYLNQTGNLSSSVGYAVVDNGREVVTGGFQVAQEGDKGAEEGKRFLQELIRQNQSGLILIVVAGMDYAKYVEDMGLDVLTTAELRAESILPRLLEQL